MRVFLGLLALSCLACGAENEPEPPPPCEQQCKDEVALRALRETMKLVYNLTLQGEDVGPQDETTECPLGGRARVFGEATSEPMQGATIVSLTYELDRCAYFEIDEEPDENYTMRLSGTLRQEGILAVQPSATTAILIDSDSVTFFGAVYDPPLQYTEEECPIDLGQSGNTLSGTICERPATVQL
jgi:hypothetical protein